MRKPAAGGGHVVSSRATAIGMMAIVLWSMMTGLMRVVSNAFGATLGSALVYTAGAIGLFFLRRPSRLSAYPKRYLIIGGALFIFYESSISLAIGLATSSTSSVEVSLVNYLWPTMMVLLTAAVSHRRHAVWLALPGAIVATIGVVLAVGGNNNLDWNAALQHVTTNPLPYAMAFVGAFAWSVYAVFTPALAEGMDGTSVFFPGVAVVLWIIHGCSGEGWPSAVPGPLAWVAVVACAAVIAGGYACWGHGILYGSMERLAVASYATPLLSVAASALLLGLSLSLPFWVGAVLVAAGSILNWWIGRMGSRSTSAAPEMAEPEADETVDFTVNQ